MRYFGAQVLEDPQTMRWGGRAALLGSFLLVFVFGFLSALGMSETLDAEDMVARFPEVKTARIVENTFYLLSLALWALHTATLYCVLRRSWPAAALAGGVMMALGLVILAVGAIPHTATAPIADLFHAPDATADSKAMLVIALQVIQGMVDAIVVTGLVLTPLRMMFLGAAMMHDPRYGSRFGWLGVLLRLAGAASAIMILIEPDDVAAVGVFALIFFHFIIGWKTARVSATAMAEAPG